MLVSFLNKETHVFSCKLSKIFDKTFFEEQLQTATFESLLLLKTQKCVDLVLEGFSAPRNPSHVLWA